MWCYETDKNNEIRYIFGENGKNPLFCIGVNPSTAEPNFLDPTVNKVKKISIINRFDGWFMINICAQRASVPDKLNHLCDEKIHLKNLELIKNYLAKYKNPLIWAAWGNLIEKRKYLLNCLKNIYEICKLYNSKWITFNNLTKKVILVIHCTYRLKAKCLNLT
jgi:hypothetical protein